MKLTTIATLATIVGAIFAALSYFSGLSQSSVKDKIPPAIESQANTIDISLDKPIYKGEKNWLAAMFNAADEMPTYAAQEEAFEKVVDASLDIGDLNVAIFAMREMPTYASKQKMIIKIVDYAVLKKETLGYGFVAGKECPTYACKQNELSKLLDAYAKIIKKKKEEKNVNVSAQSTKETDRFLVQPFSSITLFNDDLIVTLNSLPEHSNSTINLTISAKNKEAVTFENLKLGNNVVFGDYRITYLEALKNIQSYDIWLKIFKKQRDT